MLACCGRPAAASLASLARAISQPGSPSRALATVAVTAHSHSAYITFSHQRGRGELRWRGLVDAKAPADDARGVSSGEQPPSFVESMRGEPAEEAASSSRAARVLSATRLNVTALRRATPIRMWGGKGSGLPCDFCRVLVGPGDVEYEVEAQLDGAVVMLRFHYRCHYAWTGGEEPRVAADRA